MITKKMADSLNEQINKEIYSAYLYLSMSAYTDHKGLKGFANWYFVQFQEEMYHAMKIYRYLQDQGAVIKLKAIDQPPTEFGDVLEIVEKTLSHEKMVTGLINKLIETAVEEKDYATQAFLQWFVTEQVEEESNVSEILDKLKLAGNQGNGLFMIDKELASRVYTPPAQSEEQ